jgi:hypothetical protein
VNCCGAQHAPVVKPPFTFRCNLQTGFEFSPCAHAGPKVAAVEDERAGLPGVLVSAQYAVVLLPDPHQAVRGPYLSAHVQLNMPGPPPHSHVAHAGSRSEVIARCSSAS